MKKRLLIIGSGDLGQLISYHATNDGHYEVVGFLDDFVQKSTRINGIPIIGKIKNIEELYFEKTFDCVMVGIGYKHMQMRKQIFETYLGKIPFGKIMHSSSYIDKSVTIGEGVFILPGCTIDMGVIIGNNVLLNTGVVIAHDTEIGNHSFLSPAVSIAGKTKICECCIIGINATIIDNIVIENNIQIGGGAVVIDNLTEKGLYVGLPAKMKKLTI